MGAGPAGASLSCFLARYGLIGLTISSASGTSPEPRAHPMNSAALECLRDLDPSVYDECIRLGNHGDSIKNNRWAETMAGEEYARVPSWGVHGKRKSDYEGSLLEPVLVKWATAHGWQMRFDTRLVEVIEEKESSSDKKVVARVVDQITGFEYSVRTRYLFGADGGRSLVAEHIDLPFTSMPGGAQAYNVLVRADLGHLMRHQEANIHMLPRLEKDYPFVALARMVKPWAEWMFVFVSKGPDIGDADITVSILHTSRWQINETSADVLFRGHVFCLGDAIHRHPPTLGLGSNTCIQDAFNLSWKIAYVLRSLASPSLLDTYNTERQPVASKLVLDSNNTLRSHIALWTALGMQPHGSPVSARQAAKEVLNQKSPAGQQARKALRERVGHMQTESQALGTAMNQLYVSSAICAADEESAYQPGPKEQIDPKRRGIGIGLEYEDVYLDWDGESGVEEDGCVLVRPDLFVAWRSKSAGEESLRLLAVMRRVLGVAPIPADEQEWRWDRARR
ncbi:hypothetical protein SLS61_003924 [Didymella pomorum]